MKMILSAIMAAGMLCGIAGETLFSTDFANPQESRLWQKNNWAGYQPSPKFGVDEETKSFHAGPITAKHGFCMCNHSKRFNAKKGDTVVIKYEVKGYGELFFQLEVFDKETFLGCLDGDSQRPKIPLDVKWTKGEVRVMVGDKAGKVPTNRVMLDFGATKGSEFYLRNLTVEIQRAE